MNEGQAISLSGADLLANQDLDRRFAEGMSKKDIEQVMRCVWDSPGVIFVDFEGNVSHGSDSFRKNVEQMFAQCESLRLVIDEITHVRAGEETVLAVGTATYTMQMKDSASQQITERWTDVRIKAEGRWVYAMDHIHLLAPPSP